MGYKMDSLAGDGQARDVPSTAHGLDTGLDAFESVATGVSVIDMDEPEITPMREPSQTQSPKKPADAAADPIDETQFSRGRSVLSGSAILSASAAKKKKKKNKGRPTPVQAMNTVRGFTPMDSGAEDSDSSSRPDSRILSPIARFPALAGASPHLRPASPGISGLKTQLDALALRSAAQSRSSSRAPESENHSSAASNTSDTGNDDSSEDMVSYHIQFDQDFVSQSVKDPATSSDANLLAAMDPDQRASSMIHRKMTSDDFTPVRCLGEGAYGTVHLVRQNATGRLFAQKQLTKAFLKVHKRRVESTKSERSILELVNRHPFVVNLYYAFQDREKLYLILEYASGGELFRHLEMEKFFSEEVAAFYMAEIILALDYLHNTVGVIYRDLKPENCLLDADGHLLLTDFGLSKVAVQDASTPGGSRCNSLGVGTIEYMAPEIIRGSEDSDWGPGYGKACDWWSLGAMACDLMTGKPPFGGGNWTKIQQNILFQKLNLPYFLTPDAKDLLTRLLRKEPRKRLGVGPNDLSVMKKHRFFKRIDWKKLEKRELEPPIKPIITNLELAENFDTQFTKRPVDVNTKHSRTLSKTDPFGGFSYVASSSLLEASMLGDLDEAIEE